MNDLAICIRNIIKDFGHFRLGPLNMNVPPGAIYGLIGLNGAGKSTTIDLIMGMGRPDEGSIEVFGMTHKDSEVKIKERIGYVSPELSYNAWGKVNRLIRFLKKFYSDWDDEYCRKLLDRLSIGEYDKIPSLSFGSKVKLNLIMALSHHPQLLLLDEPAIGVDAVAKKEIYTELLSAVQDPERTVLIASNTLSEVERFCDHFGMIHNGDLLVEGPTADIVESYRIVDFDFQQGGIHPPKTQGIFVQEFKDGRCRALVNMKGDGMEWLKNHGADNFTETPVDLEELFVSLAKR